MSAATIDRPISETDSGLNDKQRALKIRALRLLQTEIDFVPNASFRVDTEGERELTDENNAYVFADGSRPPIFGADSPGVWAADRLTHEQEKFLFREMNCLKFRANALRARLDPDQVDEPTLSRIESLLKSATDIRNHLVKVNTRLVMSIAKKFVNSRRTFDEILSDGLLVLMRAIDKFDFDRGFRFSTYAYRSILRDAYRGVMKAQKLESRFTRDAEEWAFVQVEGHSASSASDRAWSDLHELVHSLVRRLDSRDRLIIRSRYALGARQKIRTFQSLADRLGISKERVRQLERRAVAKLRRFAGEYEYEMDELLDFIA